MALLENMKCSKSAKNILPSLPPTNQRALWQEPELEYDGKEPPKAWLTQLRQLKQIHGYNEKETLKIAKKCLKGDAKLWFRIHQPQSFNSLRTGLGTRFASGPVAAVGKPNLKSLKSQHHVDGFVSTVPVSPSQYVNPVNFSNGDRSGCRMTMCPAKHVCGTAVNPSMQLNGAMSFSARSTTPINYINRSASGKSMTRVLRKSLPNAISDLNTSDSKEISCERGSVKQAVGLNSSPTVVPSDCYDVEKESVVVPGLKASLRKGMNVNGKAADSFSRSRRKEFDLGTIGDRLFIISSRSMDTNGDDDSSRKSLDPLSSINHSVSAKEVLGNKEEDTLPRRCKSLPISWQQTHLQFKHAIHSAMKGDWRYMSLDFCQFYLQCYGMRTSGSRSEKISRIRDHLELTDGFGTHKYPRNSFVTDCSGDVCVGDVIFFEQRLRQRYDLLSGNLVDNIKRKTVGRVVKDSKGPAGEQVFTIEVYWSRGPHAFRPMHPISFRGMDLYGLKPSRQMWINEESRKQMLEEKKT